MSFSKVASLLLLANGAFSAPSPDPKANPTLGESSILHKRDDITAVADLSVNNGAPQHYASGIIYGTPDVLNQIPDEYYTEMDMNYGRAGGAQLDAPDRGWIWNEFAGRFQSTYNNYLTMRKYGARFQVLPHDIWGTDHANSSTVWPGDNGDWTNYDEFLDTLIDAIKSHDMIDGLDIDIWNEPDLDGGDGPFWARGLERWLELFGRTYKRFRSDSSLDSVLLVGPSLASQPYSTNTWWASFLDYIAANDTIPDQYTWHLEGSTTDANDDLQTNIPNLDSMLAARGLPQRQININEYATFPEQVPAGNAWWISRLERYNAWGLRGNWLSGLELHDLLASLLSKTSAENGDYSYTDTSYFPNGGWNVYKYYATNMTGYRAGTTGSEDRLLDIYVTVGSDKVRVLTGARIETGTWAVEIDSLSSVGLPTEGTVNIQTWGFDWTGYYDPVGAPSDRGIVEHDYSGDSVVFPIYQTDAVTAWAFEFSVA